MVARVNKARLGWLLLLRHATTGRRTALSLPSGSHLPLQFINTIWLPYGPLGSAGLNTRYD